MAVCRNGVGTQAMTAWFAERAADMSGLTQTAISRTRLPANADVDQVANWILAVAPCLKPGVAQSAEDTEAILGHLRNRVSVNVIAAALRKTGYDWTLSVQDVQLSTALGARQMGDQASRRADTHSRMGASPRFDLDYVKLKAAELETRYLANPHNPELQERLRKDLEVLLIKLADSMPDPMPGRGQMADQRERLRLTREEILLNAARNVGAHIRQLGPLALDRLKRHERPDAAGVPYRAPNLRTAPRR
jgi:hypothetical protein